ncbi:ABC transporter permease [uncultured Kiloniella sp.]|uniref:ABC transporter permease n=1 Tax=uncultured Kiloniella sp. TaxID=1133091 RepID=UPI002624CF4E|nr:ABC transporter permease [uncultured Kiloniella sp.]
MSDFLSVFLAVVLALLVAPMLQKNTDTVWASLRQITFVKKNGVLVSTYLLGAVFIWVGLMIIAPQLYMVDFSFRDGAIGGNPDAYTLKNYSYLIFGRDSDENLFNILHLQIFLKTILASVGVTLLAFFLCYPIAYYLAQSTKGGTTRLFLIALILPFWVNEILRAFAFRILFGSSGVINVTLMGMGILDEPIDFIKADVAMYAGLSYAYILLMVFPIYNAIESLDHNQIEAARDLGSPWWRIHYRVVIPYAKPGIASGCTMVFMLSAGALAVPQILGGPSSLWFTQIIYDWFFTGGDWSRGSAYAFVLLFSCIIFVLAVMKFFKVNLGELAK